MSSTSRRWKIALGAVFYGLFVSFLARYLSGTDWRQIAGLEFSPLYLLAALPLSLAPRFLQPLAWGVLIQGYGEQPPPYAQITRVYATSWLGRYIPGKLAWIGAKVFFGRDYGIRSTTLATTSIAEATIQLATALALAFLLIGIWGEMMVLGESVWLALAALVLMTVACAPQVFNWLAGRACALARIPAEGDVGGLSTGTLLGSAALYVGIHALSGLPIYLIVKAMYPPLLASVIPELTAAFLLAGTMGTLAVFAPSGLGVREGILIVLLGLLMPKHIALAAVVVLRLWSIAMDLVYYVLALLLDRLRPMRDSGARTRRLQ